MTIRTADLFSIANSGIRSSNTLLRTTGHNISNVNTEGFVRERTNFVSQLTGGVGQGTTERVINQFAQNQLRRDTTRLGEAEAFYQRISQLDNILASEANSIAGSLSRYFSSLQTAIDEPGNVAARGLVLGQAGSTLERMSSLSDFMNQTESELNDELGNITTEANDLIKSISELNTKIREIQSGNRFEEPGVLKNERDMAIRELAEIVSIETRQKDDGTTLVNLTAGQSLVLEAGVFNVFQISGDPDITRKTLQLQSSDSPARINIAETQLGGKMGGLFSFRDEVLAPSQRELGQLALGFADAMNEQNRLGMDYDGQLGGDIFSLPSVQALNYADNSAANLAINGRIQAGQAENLSTSDYKITIDAVTAGPPDTVDITVELLNADGTPSLDTDGNPITQAYTGLEAANGTWAPILDGLELEFPDGATYAAGDEFLLQPTRYTAAEVNLDIVRGEDLAFASPIKAQGDIDNLGGAQVASTSVTNTTVDNTFADNGASAFDGAGGIHGPGAAPGGGVGAPAEIVFTAADSYQILDSAGTVITEVTNAPDLKNLLAQGEAIGAGPAWPAAFSALDNYPGYDVSLEGVPKAGDSFSISFNTNGVDDNRNGLELAGLQDVNTIRRNVSTGFSEQNGTTFHGAYANTVSSVGEKTATADIELKAAQAMEQQSSDWFQSVSGVSLDEEASNLIRFQQAYAASARVLSTAQTLFDTILGAVR
ncbi:FlgK family flagellar hook-associated protein [Lacimicrobium alkaliphilum]|uniref:Flagellar hook-associated protein 1 n=1 Tax=Lacimicrobium alkaliphilum TaxID=1526571 RepID=A0A0U2Z842_9ALTE|nr:flagellar basal body rod C-terminal domain-containing protein [Lacimicrobium alkaliphilum]ALS99091.1 flagellar biosynthesis protein FlgK [Lacimicrobium alkaliphilum]